MLHRSRILLPALAIALASCDFSSFSQDAPIVSVPGNLLTGKRPSAVHHVSHPDRLTDSVISHAGNWWQSDLTSIIAERGFVEYDLGQVVPVGCIMLQGDNNDEYLVLGSTDHQSFTLLWAAPRTGAAGMQPRSGDNLNGSARWLRLAARGGDGLYSVDELAVFSQCPAAWPPSFAARTGRDMADATRTTTVVWTVAWALFIVFLRRTQRRAVQLALLAVPAAVTCFLVYRMADIWPLSENELAVLRAGIAALTGLILLREIFGRRRELMPRVHTVMLGVLGVLALNCFYHFCMGQFRDVAKDRQTHVHPWDMRVYFPVAKYFKELRFDGVYLASVAAYLDDMPGSTPDSIGGARLRDLNDNHMRTVRESMDEINAVRGRFSPERWEEFKRDMKYFIDVMGPGDFLGSMQDHGGNATPVWILGAHLLFAKAPANEVTLTLTGLIDPLILIFLFVVIGRTFGLRTAFLCMIMFGATEYSRFGTNWHGATLRNDWMVCVGLGVCALKRSRYVLGGVLLAYAGLIRAFPTVSVLLLGVPPLFWLGSWLREKRKLPSWKAFVEAQRPALKAIAGAVGTVVVLVALSSAVFSFRDSWGIWLDKIHVHHGKPNTNHVGLRNIVSFDSDLVGAKVADESLVEAWVPWQRAQLETLESRKGIYYLFMGLLTVVALFACRKRPLYQVAMCGMFLIPIWFYPANYYLHSIFLIPLVAAVGREERPTRIFPWVGVVLMAMCLLNYYTLAGFGGDVSFTLQSWVLLAGYTGIMGLLIWDSHTRGGPNLVAAGDDDDDDDDDSDDSDDDDSDDDDSDDDDSDDDDDEPKGKRRGG